MYRFVWRITLDKKHTDEEFVTFFKIGSSILQEFSGALGTHLHKMRDQERSYFAVAEWESKESRDAMQAEIEAGETKRAKKWQQLPKNESFGTDHLAFAGEEVAVVLPANRK